MIKRIQYGSIRVLFWTLLLLAMSVSGVRFALSELNSFKTEIESQLSQYLGAQVNIAKIRGGLNVFKPELALHNINIQSQQQKETALQLKEIHLGLDLLTSLKRPLLESLHITIIGAKLSVKRLKSGSIAIHGLPATEHKQNPSWLMQGKQYKLINSQINWHDEKRNAQAIQLKHVNISINNEGQRHKIFIATELPEASGKSLSLAMDFTGDMFVPNSVNARLFVQGKNIRLEKIITGDLPFDFAITKGRGDFSLWSTWQATQMTQMNGSVLMSDAEIKGKQNNSFPLNQLELQFKLQKKQQQWQLAIQKGLLSSQQVNLDISQLAIALEQNKEGDLSHIALNCPQLNLARLNSILTLNHVLPKKIHRQLQNFAIKGEVKNLLFLANPLEETFAIRSQINNMYTKAVSNIPGINGLSLYIEGSDQQGTVQLSSQKLILKSPPQFRAPLHFKHILGELHWQQHTDNWILSSPMLEIHTVDFNSKHKFHLNLPKSNPHASILAVNSYLYGGIDAARIHHYLPVGFINNEKLVSWLDQAFTAGSVEQGKILFHGAVKDHPFTHSKGVFEALYSAKKIDLNYADNWFPIENLGAEIRFFSNSLEVDIYEGQANNAFIKQASVKIDSFANSKSLSIQGDIEGELTQARDFLLQSSIKEQVTAVNELFDMQGLFSAKINLDIPLKEVPAKIDISASPHNAQLTFIPTDLRVTNINADIHFTEREIFSDNLTAHTLGFPIEAKLDSKEESTKILISGQTDIDHLPSQLSNQLQPYFSGTSNYQVRLNIPKDINKSTKLQLITDLEGIAIDFPPMSKSKGLAHPFSLDLSMDTSGINALSINYKNRSTPENSLDIKLKKILPHWQGLIHSPIASGSIFIPIAFNKNSEISLFCEKLNLSVLENIYLKSKKASFSLHDFPSIHLESQALYWQNYNLGQLKLLTQTSDDELFIKQLNITSGMDELEFSGHWQQTQSSNITSIKGSLLSLDFGHLLKQLKLSENVVDSTAELQFSFSWPGTPKDIARQIVNGKVHAYLTNGRILSVEPGLGRVLGALDVWKLFKRLRFDFSDITEEGLSFSEIIADISINQGLASTKKFYINAMPAKINITGSTHLDTREVDLLATVLPKFPIAGTIIGSVANTVTKTFIGDQHTGGLILSLLYEIKGTWDQFKVNRQFSPALTRQTLIP